MDNAKLVENARLVGLAMVSASVLFAWSEVWSLFAITAMFSTLIPLWLVAITSTRALAAAERKTENQN